MKYNQIGIVTIDNRVDITRDDETKSGATSNLSEIIKLATAPGTAFRSTIATKLS